MNTSKCFWILTLIVVASGCTTIEDPTLMNGGFGDARRVNAPDFPTSESGQVTVAQISPNSAIAIMPPDMQHVVWRRGGSVIVAQGEPVRPRAMEEEEKKPISTTKVRDRWPLLAKDMEFDTEIRRLDMCDADNKGCTSNDCYKDLEPCEEPERYSCFMTKAGNYCIEKENTQ